MLKNLPTGIYRCKNCDKNDIIHNQGNSFAPCGVCKSNKSWVLMRQTKYST
jgi:hypothetical protein